MKQGMKIKTLKHIDGEWKTTFNMYNGYPIIIKSRTGKGIKVHVSDPIDANKVLFTLRYVFIKPDALLAIVRAKIDKYIIQNENKTV
jgi:anaerobic selenocysteine-containing dehydrogenase